MSFNVSKELSVGELENLVPHKSFCPAPFLHSYINANNRGFKLCCMSHIVGRWDNEKSLREQFEKWWTGEEMQTFRSTFLKGEMPDPCRWWCGRWESEGIFHKSDRLHFIQKYQRELQDLKDIDWDVQKGTVQYGKPVDIDLRPSKLCNLKCRSCNSLWSSEIEKEVLANEGLQKWTHWDMVTTSPGAMKRAERINWEDPNFDVISNLDLSEVRWFEVSGGETLIEPRVLKILEKLVSSGFSKKIKLHIITNCTILSRHTEELLKQFRALSFNISVDGVGETDEFLRHGTNWEKKQEVFHRLFQLPNLKWAGIMHVVQPVSVFQVYKNLEWFLQGARLYKNLHSGVTFNPVVDPWYLSPGWLDEDHKQFVLSECERAIADFKMTSQEISWLDTFYSEMKRDFGPLKERYANDFVRAQKALDQVLKVSLLEVEPKLERYFERYNPQNVSFVDEKTKKPASMFPEGKPSV